MPTHRWAVIAPIALLALPATGRFGGDRTPEHLPLPFRELVDGPKECERENRIELGDLVKLHYVGRVHKDNPNGKGGFVFDSSRDRQKVMEFRVGKGDFANGMHWRWDTGIVGLCKGYASATHGTPLQPQRPAPHVSSGLLARRLRKARHLCPLRSAARRSSGSWHA